MRKTHSKDFKLKVAIEAIKGTMSMAEIVSQYQVSASLVSKWKKILISGADKLYGSEKNSNEIAPDLEKLHAKIGQQAIEIDFLSVALGKIQ